MTEQTISQATETIRINRWFNSEGWLVAAFSLIGVLIVLNVMFRFPELGALIAQYNQF